MDTFSRLEHVVRALRQIQKDATGDGRTRAAIEDAVPPLEDAMRFLTGQRREATLARRKP